MEKVLTTEIPFCISERSNLLMACCCHDL